MDVKLNEVTLSFEGDGDYFYTATLDYQEEGDFRLRGNLLYRTPRGNDPGESLPVEVALLDANNLHLNMEQDGKARRLELKRVDPSELNDQFGHDLENHEDHDHGLDFEESSLDSMIEPEGALDQGDLDDEVID